MQDYIHQTHRELQQRGYSEKTVSAYTWCLRIFFLWVEKNKHIKESIEQEKKISRDGVIDFILMLQKEGKAPKTINLYKESIWFLCKNILYSPLFPPITLSKLPRKLPVVLSRNQIQQILDSTDNMKHKTLLALAYGAWLRVSEVVVLRVQDVDSEHGLITIQHGKGGRERRTLLPEKIYEDLHYLMKHKTSDAYIFH